MSLYLVAGPFFVAFFASDMCHLPQIFRTLHHGVKNLVVILATAEIAGNSVGQFGSRGAGIRFEIANRGHNEARHAERALETLFIDHALLNRMQLALGTGEPLDSGDVFAADGVRQDGARVVRDIIDQHGTGAAFGAIAAELGSGEAQLVTQRVLQGLLLHNVNTALLTIDIERNQPLNCAGRGSLGPNILRAEKIACGRDSARGDHAFDKFTPGNENGSGAIGVLFLVICHSNPPNWFVWVYRLSGGMSMPSNRN